MQFRWGVFIALVLCASQSMAISFAFLSEGMPLSEDLAFSERSMSPEEVGASMAGFVFDGYGRDFELTLLDEPFRDELPDFTEN